MHRPREPRSKLTIDLLQNLKQDEWVSPRESLSRAMLREAAYRFGDDQEIEHPYISMGARGVVRPVPWTD
jgi:hypothetical protein